METHFPEKKKLSIDGHEFPLQGNEFPLHGNFSKKNTHNPLDILKSTISIKNRNFLRRICLS